MNSDIYDDVVLEEIAKERFGVALDIEKVYVRNVPAGRSANASVFLTNKNKMYVIVTGSAPLTLGDVRKIVIRMGLKAEAYCAPKNSSHYFDDIAVEKFKQVYPGRHDITDADLRFYRLMAPYNPALISVSEIIGGVINQFDSNAETGWRPSVKASYKLIKTK
jgi:hypothetical protein